MMRNILILFVTLLNFWIWKILQQNIAVAAILVALTFILFRLITEKEVKKWIVFLVFILFSLTSFIMIKSDFDKGFFSLTSEDRIKLNERHFYYANELGKLFLNNKVLNYYKNYSTPVYRFERNLFSNLDFNLYFFASHPRERAGVNEFEKYSPIFIPFFAVGLLLMIYWCSVWAAIYTVAAALVSAFVSSSYSLGPILFFPLINICIVLGLINTLNFVKNRKK